MNVQVLMEQIIKTDEMTAQPASTVVSLPSFLGSEEAQNELSVFKHHIYEYQKGLRNLVLATEKTKNEETIRQILERREIAYVIHKMSDKKINVYFGEPACVEVIKTLNPKLNEISPAEDFILGIMLGYDRRKQCERYLSFLNRK